MLTLRWHDAPRSVTCKVCGATAEGRRVAEFDDPIGGQLDAVRCPVCQSIDILDQPRDFAPDDESVDDYVEAGAGIATVASRLWRERTGGVTATLEVGCNYGFGVDFAGRKLGWEAVGVEPSAAAPRGRAELDADIRHGYLTMDTDLGRTFDLVIASEVIEHVTDPLSFVETLREHIAPDGVLLITTPSADAVRRSDDPIDALSALSPGQHVFLASESGLEGLLARGGFATFEVVREGDTIVARASPGESLRPLAGEQMPMDEFLGYVEGLTRRSAQASALRLGSSVRWLRAAISAQRWEDAERAEPVVRAAFRDRYGIDLRSPRREQARLSRRTSALWPLAGAAHALALLEQHRGRRRSSARVVDLLTLSIDAIRARVATNVLFDRDLLDIWQAAADLRVKAQSRLSSRRAAGFARELVPTGVFADESDRYDARLSRLAMDLVGAGHIRTATRLAKTVESSARRASQSRVPGRAADGRDGLYAVSVVRRLAGDREGAKRSLREAIDACASAPDEEAGDLLALSAADLAQLEG